MFIVAHAAAGLIIGKVTNNYPIALVGSLVIDIDHLVPYVKHKVIFNPGKFWKTVTDPSLPSEIPASANAGSRGLDYNP